MIYAEKIVEAATKECKDIHNDNYYKDCLILGFYRGVEWFKQAIWHERDEEPTEEGVIIKRLAKNGEIYLTFSNWVKVKNDIIESQKEYGSTQDQIALCVRRAWKECGNFDKWCYLADLLPKGGDK